MNGIKAVLSPGDLDARQQAVARLGVLVAEMQSEPDSMALAVQAGLELAKIVALTPGQAGEFQRLLKV